MKMLSPKVTDNDAWALLSLRSAPASPRRTSGSGTWSPDGPNGTPIARLEGRDFEYTLRLPQRRVTVGRSSSKGEVDINMEHSSFVSRNHLQIYCSMDDNGSNRFFLTCSGKNGIFVDGVFQRKGAEPMELPRSCTLRFPSTTLKISFQALIESEIPPPPPPPVALPPKYAKPMQPLHINIPPAPRADEPDIVSPCPSPTGTISAANSCPTSPRSNSNARSMLALDLPSAATAAAFARKQHTSSDDIKEPLPYSTITAEEEVSGGGGGSANAKSKPPYSYAQLIVQAITSHPDRQLTLSGIYAYISKHYPYYKATDKGWQNSIRHNLSLNRFFVKVPRSQEEPGKGSFWRIDSSSEGKLMEQAFRRRRQRVSCFRSPVGGDLSSRSAPVSPSHYDGSFTPEGTPHSAGLVPDICGAGDSSSMDMKPEQKQQSQTIVTGPSSQQLLQLTNDLRFIQSAPVSPQGGPVQLMTVPVSATTAAVSVSRTSAGGVALHPLPTLAGRQGVYVLHQTTLGGSNVPTTVTLSNASGFGVANAAKETGERVSVMPLKSSFGNGNMLQQDPAGQHQLQQQQPQRPEVTSSSASASSSSSSASSSSMFGQLPITFIQPGATTQSNDLIQKLLQQGLMVVGRVPEDAQAPAVYSLPQGVMQSGLQPFHLVLGTQLMKAGESNASAAEPGKVMHPQILVLPGNQGVKADKLSPSKLANSGSPVAAAPSLTFERSAVKSEGMTPSQSPPGDDLKSLQNMKAGIKDEIVSAEMTELKQLEKKNSIEESYTLPSSTVARLSSEVSSRAFEHHPYVGPSSSSSPSLSAAVAAKDLANIQQVDYANAEKRSASVLEAGSLVFPCSDIDRKRFKVDSDQ